MEVNIYKLNTFTIMKLTKYVIEALVTIACAYCSYFLLSEVDSWNNEDAVFYIFAIIFFVIIGIVCVCDIIESIYYSLR